MLHVDGDRLLRQRWRRIGLLRTNAMVKVTVTGSAVTTTGEQ